MALDLETLRKEVEGYLAEAGVPVFHGFYRMLDALNQVSWDVETRPDFREFVEVGRKAGAPVFVFSAMSFSLDQIDEALDMLEDSMLSHEEKRNFENRLRQLQAYEGFTCSLDLSFTVGGQIFSYQRETDWYISLNEVIAELESLSESQDEEEGDGLSNYFSKN
jgi:hypothetical protein